VTVDQCKFFMCCFYVGPCSKAQEEISSVIGLLSPFWNNSMKKKERKLNFKLFVLIKLIYYNIIKVENK
jgi:hypothetical protein